jgi:hypothetical protein
MKKFIYLLIILAVGCCPKKNCSTYEKQIEQCKQEKSDIKSQVDGLKLENINLMDSINIQHKEINTLVNDLNLCEYMLDHNDIACDSIIKRIITIKNDSINKLSIKIRQLITGIEAYEIANIKLSNMINELSLSEQTLQDSVNAMIIYQQAQQENILFLIDRMKDALFFINDTVYIGNEAFYVIDNGTLDTVKVYFNQSTYRIVDYVFKNDTVRKYQNDFINEQNTVGQTVLLIKADSINKENTPILNVFVDDVLSRRILIDDEINIVHIYKSYADIHKIELELTNNVKTIIDKIGINRYEVDVKVIPPAYIQGTKIIMEEIGAKIIINK